MLPQQKSPLVKTGGGTQQGGKYDSRLWADYTTAKGFPPLLSFMQTRLYVIKAYT